jgi:hypothetical protein
MTQVAWTIIRLTLILKRTCGVYANGKRRKRVEDTAPHSQMKTDCPDIWKMARRFRNCRSQISTPHDHDAWLPAFASKIAPDLDLMNYRSHMWPLKGSYGLRSHLQWTSLKLLWICVTTLLLERMESNLIYIRLCH